MLFDREHEICAVSQDAPGKKKRLQEKRETDPGTGTGVIGEFGGRQSRERDEQD
jgi:hypothetical protein